MVKEEFNNTGKMIHRDGKHYSHNATKGLIKFLKVFINTYEEILSFKSLPFFSLSNRLIIPL